LTEPKTNKHQIGFLVCLSLVIGNMIGSGIFLLPSSLGDFGPISLWGWAITGTGSVLLAFVFARLALDSPHASGPLAYTEEGFGKFAGFLVGWGHWIAAWTGNAGLAVAFTSYLTAFIPELKNHAGLSVGVTLGTVWTLYFINLQGLRSIGFIQVITTVLKLLPLALFAFAGFFYFEPSNYAVSNVSDLPSFSAILATCSITLWAFLGLESATVPADSVKDPEKNIPRATVYGTLFVAILYFIVSATIFGIMSPAELRDSTAPFADAAGALWGQWAYTFVALGVIISVLGSLNGWMLIQAEVPYVAAKRNLFPKIFWKEDSKGRPIWGVTISTVLISILVLANFTGDLVKLFTFIILLASLSSLIPYLFCSLASIMIHLRRDDTDDFQWGRHLTITVVAFTYVIGAIIGSGEEVVYLGTILVMTRVSVFVCAQWEHAND